MIDLDTTEEWEPSLSMALRDRVPGSVRSQVRAANPKYVEDACDLVLRLADRDSVFDAMIGWIRSSTLRSSRLPSTQRTPSLLQWFAHKELAESAEIDALFANTTSVSCSVS